MRLLQTIASSMGVALQSAPLFDETQRPPGETEQRNAELGGDQQHAQASPVSRLARHRRAVGDSCSEVLANTRDMSIMWYDPAGPAPGMPLYVIDATALPAGAEVRGHDAWRAR